MVTKRCLGNRFVRTFFLYSCRLQYNQRTGNGKFAGQYFTRRYALWHSQIFSDGTRNRTKHRQRLAGQPAAQVTSRKRSPQHAAVLAEQVTSRKRSPQLVAVHAEQAISPLRHLQHAEQAISRQKLLQPAEAHAEPETSKKSGRSMNKTVSGGALKENTRHCLKP